VSSLDGVNGLNRNLFARIGCGRVSGEPNEPTICIYGEFGVRLEDHMAITESGVRWFTCQPIRSTIPSA
jgi:hypothetical protein